MLNLNLVSQEDKDALLFMVYRRAVLYVGGAVCAVMVIFIILLVPSFLFLNFQRKEILRELAVEEEALRTLNIVGIERRIVLLNEKTARIRAHADSKRVSDIVANLAPSGGIRIGEIKMDFAARSIVISGVASTRNALLTFEHLLEESGFVANISAPLSDLVKLTDVAFTLKGVLK